MLPATQPFPPPLAEDWSALKDAVRRFEHAWRQAPRPGIGDYLPADGPLRSRVLIELVHIDLELRLKAGESALVVPHKSGAANFGFGSEAVPCPGQVVHTLHAGPHCLNTGFTVAALDVTA